jgi:hypothetical protein
MLLYRLLALCWANTDHSPNLWDICCDWRLNFASCFFSFLKFSKATLEYGIETNKINTFIIVMITEIHKIGFNNFSGLNPSENKAMSSWESLSLAYREFEEMKKDKAKVMNMI